MVLKFSSQCLIFPEILSGWENWMTAAKLFRTKASNMPGTMVFKLLIFIKLSGLPGFNFHKICYFKKMFVRK